MSSAIAVRDFVFKKTKVRCIGTNRDPWFVAKDVAEALGLAWSSSTLANIRDDWKGVRNLRTPMRQKGGTIRVTDVEMTVINESAVYKLAFRSNKAEADAFTNWVTGEVLPAIRKTGFYAAKRQQKAIAAGKTHDWVEAREDGVQVRKTFTDTLKEHGVEAHGYPDCTNAIYVPVLGGTAPLVRAQLGLKPKANIRDSVSTEDLVKLQFAESLAVGRIDKDGLDGNAPCRAACSLAGRAVAAAVQLATEGALYPPAPAATAGAPELPDTCFTAAMKPRG